MTFARKLACLPLVAMATTPDTAPSPQSLHPCCPLTETAPCQFSPQMVRAYLFARNLAQQLREPWAVVLADLLKGRAAETNLLVQSNRGTGSLASRSRDIVLSLERCRDELGIPLTFHRVNDLSRALCRFATVGG